MAPSKEMRKKKPEPKVIRALMKEYHISFEGPIPPKEWPIGYEVLFQQVRDLSRLWYDDYREGAFSDVLTIRQTKTRVRELRRRAADKRARRAVEDAWKSLFLPIVTQRFEAEVVCRNCRREIWISEYQAFPEDEADAAALRQKRSRRRLCNCESEQRDIEERNELGNAQIFELRYGEQVLHVPNDEETLNDSGISMYPDQTIGLRNTDSFQQRMTDSTNYRDHTCFQDDQILYPFLFLEAKSEKGGPGFEAVEAQTAFPVRSALHLQQSLSVRRASNIRPLVWFFAFQGDEWRLYAGVSEEHKVKVVDLWHGHVLNQDGALQLLKIVDFICDWARNVYRPEIRRALASEARFASPSTTLPFSRSQSIVTIIAEPAILSLHDLPAVSGVVESVQKDRGSPIRRIEEPRSHPFLAWSYDWDQRHPWLGRTAVRHADVIRCLFNWLQVPEDTASLVELRDSSTLSIQYLKTVLDIMNRTQTWVLLSRREIYRLRCYWTGATRDTNADLSDMDVDERLQVFISFKTFFDPADLQITREVTCVSWSVKALENAHQLELAEPPSVQSSPWSALRIDDMVDLLKEVLAISGRMSALHAMRGSHLCATRATEQRSHAQLKWILVPEASPWHDRGCIQPLCADILPANQLIVRRFFLHAKNLVEVCAPQEQVEVETILPAVSNADGTRGALWLRKPEAWPDSCPQFALVILESKCFDDQAKFHQLLLGELKAKQIFVPLGADMQPLLNEDKHLHLKWLNALAG